MLFDPTLYEVPRAVKFIEKVECWLAGAGGEGEWRMVF